MTKFNSILLGSAGIAAAMAFATPAAAQSYPYGYAQPNSGGVLGAIINSVTGGYGQYPMGNYGYQQVDQRMAVNQCAGAAEQRLNAQYRGQGYGAYNGYNGYQNGYGGYAQQGGARVLGITAIERRSNGSLKVRGVASTGAYMQQGYRDRYGNPVGMSADVSFSCKVNLRGQVSDVRFQRERTAYRGY